MNERRWLQAAVALGCCVPLAAGLGGMVLGVGLTGNHYSPDLDSHVRYLSGLLFAIGLGFVSCLPRIEAKGARFGLLTLLVVCGGLGRLYGVLLHGLPGPPMRAGLGMELVVTPLLMAWQRRMARQEMPGRG